MIETIYSNNNSDSDRIGKTQSSLKMPKNIRQVGKGNGFKKIYIEDYVMTYVKQLSGEEYAGLNIAVLVGQCVRTDSSRNIFISGAVKVNDVGADTEIVFTNDTWTAIYEDIKQYFVDCEIVGWFIGGPGDLLEEEEKILRNHLNNFGGKDKILLAYDSLEKEETFLSYENNRLNKQEGYYIYYEKNDEMQSYIIDHKKPVSIEAEYDDRVSREIRTTIQRNTEQKEEVSSKNVARLMYAAGTLLAIIVLIVGATMLRGFDQMKNMQNTLDTLTHNMQNYQGAADDKEDVKNSDKKDNDKTSPDKTVTPKATDKPVKNSDNNQTSSDGDGLDVEVEPGNVNPIKKNDTKTANNSTTKNSSTNKPKSTQTSKPQLKYYTVKEGDTLADISHKLYNTYTKVKKIMELNGITDQDHIKIGQKLIVP